MDDSRLKALRAIHNGLGLLKSAAESVLREERNEYDEMSESAQGGSIGEDSQHDIKAMDLAIEDMDSSIGRLEEILDA